MFVFSFYFPFFYKRSVSFSFFLFVFFLLAFLFIFCFFEGYLHSGKSKVTRDTVGRDIHPTSQSCGTCKGNVATLEAATNSKNRSAKITAVTDLHFILYSSSSSVLPMSISLLSSVSHLLSVSLLMSISLLTCLRLLSVSLLVCLSSHVHISSHVGVRGPWPIPCWSNMFASCKKQFVQVFLCKPRATWNEVGLYLCWKKRMCLVWCGVVWWIVSSDVETSFGYFQGGSWPLLPFVRACLNYFSPR